MRKPEEVQAKIDGYVQKLLRTNPLDSYEVSSIQARVDELVWMLEGKEE